MYELTEVIFLHSPLSAIFDNRIKEKAFENYGSEIDQWIKLAAFTAKDMLRPDSILVIAITLVPAGLLVLCVLILSCCRSRQDNR